MKVSQVIKMLKELQPDDEIVVAFWDVDCFHGSVLNEDGVELPVIPRNVWNAYASAFEFRDTIQEMCWDDIQWGLQDYVTKLELEQCALCDKHGDTDDVQEGVCEDCFREMPVEKWVSGKKGGE